MGETNGRPPAMLLPGRHFPFFHYANCPWLGLITTAPRFCRCKEPGMGYPRWQRQRKRVCLFATRHPGLGPGIHTPHPSFSPQRESRALIEGRNGCADRSPAGSKSAVSLPDRFPIPNCPIGAKSPGFPLRRESRIGPPPPPPRLPAVSPVELDQDAVGVIHEYGADASRAFGEILALAGEGHTLGFQICHNCRDVVHGK